LVIKNNIYHLPHQYFVHFIAPKQNASNEGNELDNNKKRGQGMNNPQHNEEL